MNKAMISLVVVASLAIQSVQRAKAETAESLKADATQALTELYESSTDTRKIGTIARAVLVFPEVKKIGLLAGFSYGKGVMFKNGEAVNFYSSKGVSWGMQAGGQRFGYALFFMSDEAVDYLDRSNGWEIGAGPSVTVGDNGISKKVSTTTFKSDIHTVVFNQQGLMAGMGVEGNKITRLKW